ncbi:beta-hexosaminidase [Ramicandelaber brevisporus]|nr:beta-hexosaminidase [Ramicandelaber brevisporus]
MKFTALVAGMAVLAASASTGVNALWPIPQNYTQGNSTLVVGDGFWFNVKTPHNLLASAVSRYQDIFVRQKHLPPHLYNLTFPGYSHPQLTNLDITVKDTTKAELKLGVDESYTLNVPEKGGAASLSSNTVWGAIRGLETFIQLLVGHTNKQFILNAPVAVTDYPKYQHRGIMLDTSRNYYPVADILRTLDAMAWNKMNVFHWHIVDSHSWPLVSEKFPLLSGKGAYSQSQVYTKRDIQQIIAYAYQRGIRVIPEFEMPGHNYAFGLAYPNLTVCSDLDPYDDYAAEPPSGQLDISNKDLYPILSEFLKEQATYFNDEYVHLGADEINKKCYNDTPHVAEWLKAQGKNASQALSDFGLWAHGELEKLGKYGITWEEEILEEKSPLPKDRTIVQVWKGAANTKLAVDMGYKVIAGSYEYNYLDCGHGGWLGNWTWGNSWCDPYKSWQRVYDYHPTANLTVEQTKNVLGSEVLLWSEQSDTHTLDSFLWPRASAGAEVYWSGRFDASGVKRDVAKAMARITDMRHRLVERGVGANPLQPLWCARHPGRCNTTPGIWKFAPVEYPDSNTLG